MSKSFTPADVAKHKTDADGLYVIIDGGVYNVTDFVEEHPGGEKILRRMAGRDASKAFWKYHSAKVLDKYSERLKVGTLAESAKL
ncbi:cytochrome b5 [Grosmannia clavigera kw1407]|uniref:Cytochrome b5 n=1 Tax=Grosmannia clavigera (strain kw1407 / UAMH 11150) TaxID=655863 RepID=F0XEQ0_GROCL|nr:cytochrome b5 [Grosmannia clavigera kw1407]EFX04465.1 cytochrome b5 [Grosmannia clavigera kw1407]